MSLHTRGMTYCFGWRSCWGRCPCGWTRYIKDKLPNLPNLSQNRLIALYLRISKWLLIILRKKRDTCCFWCGYYWRQREPVGGFRPKLRDIKLGHDIQVNRFCWHLPNFQCYCWTNCHNHANNCICAPYPLNFWMQIQQRLRRYHM